MRSNAFSPPAMAAGCSYEAAGAATIPASAPSPCHHEITCERLDTVCDLLGGWLWEMGPDLRFTYFSDNVERLAGRAPEWHYGKTRQEVGTLNMERPEVREHLEALANRSVFRALDFERMQEGRSLWMRTVGQPLFDANGSFKRYRGFAFDITQQKEAERERAAALHKLYNTERQLKQQHAQLQAAVSSMRQGLAMFDRTGKLLVWNKQFLNLMRLPDFSADHPMRHSQMTAHWHENGTFASECTDQRLAMAYGDLNNRFDDYRDAIEELSDGTLVAVHREVMDGGWVATYDDVTHEKRAEAAVRRMADTDALTGLRNRASFDRRIRAMVEASSGDNQSALFVIDLDDFKYINDTRGHLAGDEILREVARRLTASVRDDDFVGRLGGDEFAVLCPGLCSREAAIAIAERLVASFVKPHTVDGCEVPISASIGLATAPHDATSSVELLQQADTAMYQAKECKQTNFSVYNSAAHQRMNLERALEAELYQAIERDELVLHYQPVYDTTVGSISYCEALVRWEHPERGLLPPNVFIPIAEKSSLIVALGNWVVQKACNDAKKWPEEIGVSVNISPTHLHHPSICDVLEEALRENRLAPERLEVEITELALWGNSGAGTETVRKICELGIRIAMDDFGTGYSSLSMLQETPFSRLKIDRSFVKDLPRSERALKIIRSIMNLSKGLGLGVTVEGVETSEQLEAIKLEGCNLVQGFLFARPQTNDSILELLGNGQAGT